MLVRTPLEECKRIFGLAASEIDREQLKNDALVNNVVLSCSLPNAGLLTLHKIANDLLTLGVKELHQIAHFTEV